MTLGSFLLILLVAAVIGFAAGLVVAFIAGRFLHDRDLPEDWRRGTPPTH